MLTSGGGEAHAQVRPCGQAADGKASPPLAQRNQKSIRNRCAVASGVVASTEMLASGGGEARTHVRPYGQAANGKASPLWAQRDQETGHNRCVVASGGVACAGTLTSGGGEARTHVRPYGQAADGKASPPLAQRDRKRVRNRCVVALGGIASTGMLASGGRKARMHVTPYGCKQSLGVSSGGVDVSRRRSLFASLVSFQTVVTGIIIICFNGRKLFCLSVHCVFEVSYFHGVSTYYL